MEIKNSLNTVVNPYQKKVQNSDSQRSAKGTQAASLSKGDTVNVSSQAKLLTEAHSTASADSGIRLDKVAAIKEQLSSGAYSIDSKNIASKLLQSESELGLITS